MLMKEAWWTIKNIWWMLTFQQIPSKKKQTNGIAGIKDGTEIKSVTIGYDGLPTILMDGQFVFNRETELVLNKKYYPNWPVETWPICPVSGIKLPIGSLILK